MANLSPEPVTWLADGVVSIRWETEGIRVVYHRLLDFDSAFIPWEQVAWMYALLNPDAADRAVAAARVPEETAKKPAAWIVFHV